jgi:glyoxylase-like metal-dependent hydrolase (beta-lactamase superfamily II)
MNIGSIRCDLVSDGTFRLDGGAMFGVVPRSLWERKTPPDSRNRITLGTNALLIRVEGRNILVDAGVGRKEPEPFREMFALGGETDIVTSLSEQGLAPQDIDTVVLTHLHFDHAGGITRRAGDGEVVPVFPKARHIVQRAELDDAEHPTSRSRASYLPENWVPVREAGLLDVVEGEVEVASGVRTVLMKGHVRSLTGVRVESGDECAFYPTDNMPTAAHIPAPWVMGYDLYPLDTLSFKESFLPRAVDEECVVFFEHDPRVGAARILRDGKRWAVEELLRAPGKAR